MYKSQKCTNCACEPVCGFKDAYMRAAERIIKMEIEDALYKRTTVHESRAVEVEIKCPHIVLLSNTRREPVK